MYRVSFYFMIQLFYKLSIHKVNVHFLEDTIRKIMIHTKTFFKSKKRIKESNKVEEKRKNY